MAERGEQRPVDTASLIGLARSLAREGFVARFSNLFFITAIEADATLRYETVVAGHERPRAAVAPRAVTQPPPATPASSVVIELVKAPGNPYPDRISVGRARNCDVVLRDPSVSKLHAHVRVDGAAVQLVDLDSQNGTRVNGTRLAPNTPHPIAPGDLATFGRVTGRIADAAALYDLLRG